MNRFFTFAVMLVVAQSALAQSEAVFCQYMVNPMLINPAGAAVSDKHQLFIMGRNQWLGMPGQPQTMALSYNGPFTDRIRLGAMVMNDRVTDFQRLRAQFNYAQWYKLPKGGRIAGGLSGEFHNYRLVNTVLDNPLNSTADVVMSDYMSGLTFFDATFGVYYEPNKRMYASFSLPNLIRTRLGEINSPPRKMGLQYVLLAGYKHPVLDAIVEPFMQVRKVLDSPFQTDFGIRAYNFSQSLLGSVMVRPGDGGAIAASIGTRWQNIQIHYAFETSWGKFSQYSQGTHEIMLGIAIDRKPPSFDRTKKISD